MDTKERERLEETVRICKKTGADTEQFLIVRMRNVEEYLKLEKMMRDLFQISDQLYQMKTILYPEVSDEQQED